jgi:hypothetical protein
MCVMRRSEPPGRDWPEAPGAGPDAARSYAPETLLIPDAEPGPADDHVQGLVTRLPDGSGPLRRVGICNASGMIYREVSLHGPVQLLYFWAGLNGLGFRERPPDDRGFSRYWRLFVRQQGERRPAQQGQIRTLEVTPGEPDGASGRPTPERPAR